MVTQQILKRLFLKPGTNKFPAKYLPKSVNRFLEKVSVGKAHIGEPIPIPEKFRGKLCYDRETCTGCRICTRVCPANAIEYKPEEKKIRIHLNRCTFCGQCVDACPFGSLSMSKDCFLSDCDKNSPNFVIE